MMRRIGTAAEIGTGSKPVLPRKKRSRYPRSSKRSKIRTDVVSRHIEKLNSDNEPLSRELCSRCKQIEFDTLFEGPQHPDTLFIPSTEVGSVQDIIEGTRCPFCRLLAHAIPIESTELSPPSREELMCHVTPQRADYLDDEVHQTVGYTINVCTLLAIKIKKRGLPVSHATDIPLIASIQQPKGVGCRTLLRASWLPSFIDFEGVKHWIQECETNHQSSCESSADIDCGYLSSGFTVIDVEIYGPAFSPSNVLRKCDHRITRYVALSYVWNQGSVSSGEISPQGRETLRRGNYTGSTIADAIEVCKKLGERYLWVDRLCISADQSEKRAQISRMDSIYRHAILTIIAAPSRDSPPWLPGVTAPRDQSFQRDRTEQVGDRLMTLSKAPLHSCLSRSSWATRGWTFQEGVLSQRCLVFTDDELFWCCHRCLRKESVCNVPKEFFFTSVSSLSNSLLNITTRVLGSEWDYRTYTRLLNQYTGRKLTFQSDAVSAFSGLLKLLSRRFGTEFLSGHPFSNFITSLCWYGRSDLTARNNFPSWSWAGWTGSISHDACLIITPVENRKSATLAEIEPLSGGQHLRISSQIAKIALSQENGGGNGTQCSARGWETLINKQVGRFFFVMALPAKFDLRKHPATDQASEFLMLARLRDSDYSVPYLRYPDYKNPDYKNPDFKYPNVDAAPQVDYVVALFLDRSGDRARRLGLLAIPSQIWDDASPQPVTMILE